MAATAHERRKYPIYILNLGAGVQSSTTAFMAAHGEITPMPVIGEKKGGIMAATAALGDREKQLREAGQRYRRKNREKLREAAQRYRRNNREKILEARKPRDRERYWRNCEKLREDARNYRRNNREKLRETDQRYRRNNREKCNKHNRDYSQRNRTELSAKYLQRLAKDRFVRLGLLAPKDFPAEYLDWTKTKLEIERNLKGKAA